MRLMHIITKVNMVVIADNLNREYSMFTKELTAAEKLLLKKKS